MRENDLGKETEKLKAFKAKLEEQLTASKAVVSASFDLVFFYWQFSSKCMATGNIENRNP